MCKSNDPSEHPLQLPVAVAVFYGSAYFIQRQCPLAIAAIGAVAAAALAPPALVDPES